MPVRDLKRKLTRVEYLELLAYRNLNTFDLAGWEQTGVLASSVINAMGGKSKIYDFMPIKKQQQPRKTAAQIEASIKAQMGFSSGNNRNT